MIARFNKDTQRWGIWVNGGETFSVWLCHLSEKIMRFNSKQEAEKYITKLKRIK